MQFLFSNFKCKLMFVSLALCYPFSLLCFCFHCMNNISLIFSGLRLNCQPCKPFLHNWCCCTATRACVLIQPSKELTSLIGVLHQNLYHIYDGQLRVLQVHIKSCYETKWIWFRSMTNANIHKTSYQNYEEIGTSSAFSNPCHTEVEA